MDKHKLKIIIFCATKRGVDDLDRNMKSDRALSDNITFDVRGIHGDKM